MPSFLSDLRRRSRNSNSLKSEPVSTGTDTASNSGGSNDGSNDPPTKASSFSNLVGHFKPGSEASNNSTPSIAKTPPLPPSAGTRPSLAPSHSSRQSTLGSPLIGSSPRVPQHTSPLAPMVNSITDGSWVHQKVLLISGALAEPQQPLDGHLIVCHHQDSFPATQWPVCESHFKALVHLQPGPNRIRLDFLPSPSRRQSAPNVPHSSWLTVHYLPLAAAPPLHLVILVAKDSPMTYDAVPDRVNTEGNGIETAIKKYRMAGYLWQAFTGEQMNRNGFARRCFRFDEEWQPGTSSNRDMNSGTFRNEAKVHVVRLDKTVAEVRDLEYAQQHGPAQAKADLFGIAIDACKKHFEFKDGHKQYVAAMFLDSHWDKAAGTIRAHAALGGGAGGMGMAIFGSHCLQSYPAHIEEVVPAFTDCTKTDLDYVANDAGESGSSWEAANIGIGAHLHEVGHLLGSPHQEHGVMLRDFNRLNRTFLIREAFCTRTRSPGLKFCQAADECAWHRLDTLRFRFHPCFVTPTDPVSTAEDSVQVWAVDGNAVMVTAPTGVGWIELKQEGDDLCHAWVEYFDGSTGVANAPRQVTLNEAELRAKLPNNDKNKKLVVSVFSCGQANHTISDFGQLAGKTSRTKLPDGRFGYRGDRLGDQDMTHSTPDEVIWESAYVQTKLLTTVRVWHGSALDGLEFLYEDGSSQLIGKRGGKPGGDDFQLDTRRGEMIFGFYVRSGAWIDGIQILTTQGRKSEIYGNPTGGGGCTIIPPRGYNVVGLHGSVDGWMRSLGLIIAR